MNQQKLLNYLFTITAGFVAGIIYGTYEPLAPEELPYLVAGTIFVLVAGYTFAQMFDESPEGRKFVYFLLILSIALLLGWGRYSASLGRLEEDHISDFTVDDWSKTSVIEGTVIDQPTVNRNEAELLVEPDKIWPSKDSNEPIEVTGGNITVIVQDSRRDQDFGYEEASSNKIYADRLRIEGALIGLPPKTNPGGGSFARYLSRQGIFGSVWPDKIKRLEKRRGNPLVALALDLQTEMLRVVKKTMPYPQSAFLGGSTLGLRGGLEFTTTPFGEGKNLISHEFKAAGTYHVLAVSGLHVGVIAGALLALFSGLRIPQKIYAPLILFALLIFTIITGARPATIRASIMMGLVVIGMAYLEQGLKDSVLFGLSLAALLILLYRPRLIYQAAFTLSFSAVLCLALLTGPIEEILNKVRDLTFITFWFFFAVSTVLWMTNWNWFFSIHVYLPYFVVWGGIFWLTYRFDRNNRILQGFGFEKIPTAISGFIAAQFAIQLGMMWPLSAYYFMKFPYAGGYANFVAIPLVGVVVPLGLMAELVGLIPSIGSWLALVLNAGNYLAVTAFLWISHVFTVYFPYPAVRKLTLFHLFCLYSALALLAFWKPIYGYFSRTIYWVTDNIFHRLVVRPRRLFQVFLATGAIILFGMSYQYEPSVNSLRVTVLDVGYGSSIAIQTPDRKRILINGGARKWDWHNKNNLPDRYDPGERTIAPFFLNQRIKSLDMIVAQSTEPQYIGGLPYILNQFSVSEVYGPMREDSLKPLSLDNYVNALDNYYYRDNQDASWFKNDYYKNWKRLWTPLKNKDIPYSRPTRGTELYTGNFSSNNERKITLSVLNPDRRANFDSYSSQNRSLVLSLKVEGGPSFLFPGDIRREAQQNMIDYVAPQKLRHDVMMAPSNGMQDNSISDTFVKKVDPDTMVFSTGRPDIKGPLAEDLQDQLKKNWKKAMSLLSSNSVYRTDRDYAVIFKTKGESLSIETYAERWKTEEKSSI